MINAHKMPIHIHDLQNPHNKSKIFALYIHTKEYQYKIQKIHVPDHPSNQQKVTQRVLHIPLIQRANIANDPYALQPKNVQKKLKTEFNQSQIIVRSIHDRLNTKSTL